MPRPSSLPMVVPSFADLEQVALCIIHLIKDIPGLADMKLSLIGDLAVRNYLPESSCNSIEFVIDKTVSPSQVKKKISSHPMTPLYERQQAIFYRHKNGWEIEVKTTPVWLCPFLPDSSQAAKEVNKALPYISLSDLIVFKADACGLHESTASRQRESCETAALLERASEHFPLALDDEEKLQKIEEALEVLVENATDNTKGKSWWSRRLEGLKKCDGKQRSVQDIFSELSLDQKEEMRRPSILSLRHTSSSSSWSPSSGSFPSRAMPPPESPAPRPPLASPRPRKMSVSGIYPRPQRHTRTSSLEPLPDGYLTSNGLGVFGTGLNVQSLHPELLENGGRYSPGIALVTKI